MFKKYIHYDTELEMAVLGSLLLEKSAISRIKGILSPECFYMPENACICKTIIDMWDESYPVDIMTVTSRILRSKNGQGKFKDIITPYYITKLINVVVSTANLEAHCLILRQLYAERELLKIKNSVEDETYDVIERTKKMQDELFKITQIKVTDDWMDMSEVVMNLQMHMDEVAGKEIIGVPTGFYENGIGFGITISAPAFSDEALLNLAQRLEQST